MPQVGNYCNFLGLKSAILALPSTPTAQSAVLRGQTWLLPGGTAQVRLDLLQESFAHFLKLALRDGLCLSLASQQLWQCSLWNKFRQSHVRVVCSINTGFSVFSKSPFTQHCFHKVHTSEQQPQAGGTSSLYRLPLLVYRYS